MSGVDPPGPWMGTSNMQTSDGVRRLQGPQNPETVAPTVESTPMKAIDRIYSSMLGDELAERLPALLALVTFVYADYRGDIDKELRWQRINWTLALPSPAAPYAHSMAPTMSMVTEATALRTFRYSENHEGESAETPIGQEHIRTQVEMRVKRVALISILLMIDTLTRTTRLTRRRRAGESHPSHVMKNEVAAFNVMQIVRADKEHPMAVMTGMMTSMTRRDGGKSVDGIIVPAGTMTQVDRLAKLNLEVYVPQTNGSLISTHVDVQSLNGVIAVELPAEYLTRESDEPFNILGHRTVIGMYWISSAGDCDGSFKKSDHNIIVQSYSGTASFATLRMVQMIKNGLMFVDDDRPGTLTVRDATAWKNSAFQAGTDAVPFMMNTAGNMFAATFDDVSFDAFPDGDRRDFAKSFIRHWNNVKETTFFRQSQLPTTTEEVFHLLKRLEINPRSRAFWLDMLESDVWLPFDMYIARANMVVDQDMGIGLRARETIKFVMYKQIGMSGTDPSTLSAMTQFQVRMGASVQRQENLALLPGIASRTVMSGGGVEFVPPHRHVDLQRMYKPSCYKQFKYDLICWPTPRGLASRVEDVVSLFGNYLPFADEMSETWQEMHLPGAVFVAARYFGVDIKNKGYAPNYGRGEVAQGHIYTTVGDEDVLGYTNPWLTRGAQLSRYGETYNVVPLPVGKSASRAFSSGKGAHGEAYALESLASTVPPAMQRELGMV